MPNLDFLSRTFRQSRATFCRRLKEEGASLQAIKQHCRLELATDYLLNTKMTNAEVADRLGFSCAKAFAAAFKKWNGSPPAEFRAREQSRGDPRGM